MWLDTLQLRCCDFCQELRYLSFARERELMAALVERGCLLAVDLGTPYRSVLLAVMEQPKL